MPFPENIYLHALNQTPLVGAKRLQLLLDVFGSAQTAWNSTPSSWLKAGLPEEVVLNFSATKKLIQLEQEQETLARSEIALVSQTDANFPALLREIPVPPVLLYVRGQLPAHSLALAVVGARRASPYGKSVMSTIVSPLVRSGLLLVSGLAYGIDALAHQLCVEASRPTVAVLGCGLDDATIYPRDHVLLASEILAAGGALVSEYAPKTPALPHNFVARNRIISGLCSGTLIVECSQKSGTLITAQYALEQNRLLFVPPGSIFSEQHQGTNNLLKLGAIPVTEAADILVQLNLDPAGIEPAPAPELNPQEELLLQHIGHEPLHIDLIIAASGWSAEQVGSTLTFLELKGCVRNLGAGQFVKLR